MVSQKELKIGSKAIMDSFTNIVNAVERGDLVAQDIADLFPNADSIEKLNAVAETIQKAVILIRDKIEASEVIDYEQVLIGLDADYFDYTLKHGRKGGFTKQTVAYDLATWLFDHHGRYENSLNDAILLLELHCPNSLSRMAIHNYKTGRHDT
jgi:hypothetical protein